MSHVVDVPLSTADEDDFVAATDEEDVQLDELDKAVNRDDSFLLCTL